jgi:hypothetical protein
MTTTQILEEFQIRKLSNDEKVTSFNCGDDDLNDFILNEAPFYGRARLAVTYLIEQRLTSQVVGYFTLANDKISLTDFENKTEFNRFRKKKFVNDKRLRSYPAAKLCRLAIDISMKGKSLGTFVIDFVKSFFAVENKIGCRFLTVDAYSAAIPFYLKNKFLPLDNTADKSLPTQMMYFDLDNID